MATRLICFWVFFLAISLEDCHEETETQTETGTGTVTGTGTEAAMGSCLP